MESFVALVNVDCQVGKDCGATKGLVVGGIVNGSDRWRPKGGLGGQVLPLEGIFAQVSCSRKAS